MKWETRKRTCCDGHVISTWKIEAVVVECNGVKTEVKEYWSRMEDERRLAYLSRKELRKKTDSLEKDGVRKKAGNLEGDGV